MAHLREVVGAWLVAASVGCNLSTYGIADGDSGSSEAVDGPTTTSEGGTTSVGTPTSTGSGGGTSGGGTTGGPIDTSVTLRIDMMAFIDPHLFLDDTRDPNAPTCVTDITEAINGVLADDIESGEQNLLLRFEDYPAVQELRIITADCDVGETPGDPRVCTPSDGAPAVILGLEAVGQAQCRDIDPAVYAADNLAQINEPGQPCVRTKRASFSVMLGEWSVGFGLREGQFVATLDDAVAPTRLVNGVLYGFLPQQSAEELMVEIPLLGERTMWSVVDVPACAGMYPTLLPSVDTLKINDMDAPGVWLAINFTAERVVFEPGG